MFFLTNDGPHSQYQKSIVISYIKCQRCSWLVGILGEKIRKMHWKMLQTAELPSWFLSNYKARNLCLYVLCISPELFIQSTSHLMGVLLGTQGLAVSNLVKSGHSTRSMLIHFEEPIEQWSVQQRGRDFRARINSASEKQPERRDERQSKK